MKKVLKSTIILTIIMFVAKLSGFVRDIVLTNKYGASYISDAYLISVSVPNVLFSGIVTAVYTCYIPVYKEVKAKEGEKVAKFNSNLVTVIILLSGLFVIIYQIFSDYILRLFAAGFDDNTFLLAKNLTAIMTLSMLFMGIAYILQGYLQANNSFYLVGAMTIPANIIMAFSIWLSSEKTLMYMAWGTVLSYAMYVVYFGIPAYQKGFRYRTYVNLKDPYLKKILLMVLPIFSGQIIFEINSMVDKSLASTLPAGGVTSLDYSFKIAVLGYSSIVAPICAIIYPKFSQFNIEKKEAELKLVLADSLRIVLVLVVPVVGGIIVLANKIVQVLYFRGAFTMNQVNITTETLLAYVGCIVPISLRMICEKVFYAKQETKIPMLNSFVGIGVNIVLDVLLVRQFAHIGLAFATTVSSIVTCLLFLVSLYRRIGKFSLEKIGKTAVTSIIATGGMCIALYEINKLINLQNDIILILLDFLVGAMVYGFLLILFREEIVLKYIRHRRGK